MASLEVDDVFLNVQKPLTSNNEEKPLPLSGHASQTVGDSIFYHHIQGLFELNTKSLRWKKISEKNGASILSRRNHSFHYVKHLNSFLIFGGIHQKDSKNISVTKKDILLNDLCLFHLGSQKWSIIEVKKNLQDIPCCRCSHSSIIRGNCLYIYGGLCETSGSVSKSLDNTSLFKYDIEKKYWKRFNMSGSLPFLFGHRTVKISEDEMLFLYGVDGAKNNKRFFLYNFKSNHCKEVVFGNNEEVPPPRSYFACVKRGRFVFLFGGERYYRYASITLNDMWRYDTISGKWCMCSFNGNILKGTTFCATNFIQNKMYLFGGGISFSKRSNELVIGEFEKVSLFYSLKDVDFVRSIYDTIVFVK